MASSTRSWFPAAGAAAPFLIMSTAVFLAPVQMAAQATSGIAATAKSTSAANPAKYTPPRLADGRPDFTGFWSNNTATPVERPASFKGREYLTPEEAKTVEKASVRVDEKRVKGAPCAVQVRPGAICPGALGGPGSADVGDYNAVFLEDGKRVVSTLRTSIITDPKDGKLPPMTQDAQRRAEADAAHQLDHPFDGPEDLSVADRCISGSGTPMLPRGYNNTIHIIQTPTHVAIAAEMMHDVRVVPIDGRSHGGARQWLGDAVGHYEGDTLVIENTNFNGKRGWPGSNIGRRADEKMKVTERFTRTAPDVLLYQFTVEDPGLYTRPYSGEITMWPSEHPVYEYACHEGNYSMPLILSGARAEEKAVASKRTTGR